MATIKDFALKYREELLADPTEEKAKEIANKINSLRSNGQPLTKENIELLLTYIEDPSYNPKTGQRMLLESDNSAFLDIIGTINSNIKKGGN